MARGLFITFEGGEGVGKSTQARLLYRRLRRSVLPVLLVHEPGGDPLALMLRRWLKRESHIVPTAELLLFAACRAQLVTRVLKPALERGMVVVCDRFADSTLAYQGYGRGLNLRQIQQVNRVATAGLRPNLTVLLDVPVETGLSRKSGDSDRFISEPLPFHQRVREGYLQLAQSAPRRWLVLDGTQPEAAIAQQIWERLTTLLERVANR